MDPVSVLLATLFLAWLFLSAGCQKLREPVRFAGVISAYRLPLLNGSVVLARSVALLEIAVALTLLIPFTRVYAALGAGLLLAAYGGAIGINIVRGRRDIDCGCSGPANRQPLSGWLLWRNAVLLLLAFCAGAELADRTLGWLDWVVILMGSLVAVLLYQICERLLSNNHLLLNLRS